MVSGFNLGIAAFSFIVCVFCFYLSTKVNNPAMLVILGIINGICGIINTRAAFL